MKRKQIKVRHLPPPGEIRIAFPTGEVKTDLELEAESGHPLHVIRMRIARGDAPEDITRWYRRSRNEPIKATFPAMEWAFILGIADRGIAELSTEQIEDLSEALELTPERTREAVAAEEKITLTKYPLDWAAFTGLSRSAIYLRRGKGYPGEKIIALPGDPTLHPARAKKMAHIQSLMDATGLSEATIRQKLRKGISEEQIISPEPGYRKGPIMIGTEKRTAREWSEYTKALAQKLGKGHEHYYVPYKTFLYRWNKGLRGEDLIAPLGTSMARVITPTEEVMDSPAPPIPDWVQNLIREARQRGESREIVAQKFVVPPDVVDLIEQNARTTAASHVA